MLFPLVYFCLLVLWAPPVKYHSTCKLDVSFFPFDDQICALRFGSWIYDGRQVCTARIQVLFGCCWKSIFATSSTFSSQSSFLLRASLQVDVTNRSDKITIDKDSFTENGEWQIVSTAVERHVNKYPCCPNTTFPDLTFYLHLRRRTLYYQYNIIIPCVMLSVCLIFSDEF